MDKLRKRAPLQGQMTCGIKSLILFVLLCVCIPVTAQNSQITINAKDVTLKSVIEQIEKQTDYHFIYNKNIVDLGKHVTVQATNESLKNVLLQMFSDSDVVFSVEKKQIILSKKTPDTKNKGESNVSQYKVKVHGVVADTNGDPLVGVSITSKTVSGGVTTNIDGEYSWEVPAGTTINFSYVGFDPIGRKVTKSGELNIRMNENSQLLNEVVVTGYGATTRKNLTTSIATVKTDKIQKAAVSNVNSLLLGRAAGIQATESSTQPGGGINISVRGGGTPVYVIDGVVVPNYSLEPGSGNVALPNSINRSGLQGLNPNDIESIEVLKDASAAIYGIGAADGVILITTKKGAEGKPTVTYDGSYTWKKSYKMPEFISGAEYMNFVNLFNKEYYLIDHNQYPYGSAAYDNKWVPIFSQKQIDSAPNHDWVNDELKPGYVTNHNVAVSGGTQSIKYYLGLNYYNEDATVRNSNMERFALRTNVSAQLCKFIKFTTIANINQNKYRNSTNGSDQGNLGDQGAGALYSAESYPSYLTPYDEDGNYTQFGRVPNPVALRNILDNTNFTSWYVNFALDIDIIKNMLSFRGVYGANQDITERDSYIPSDVYFALQRKSRGNVGYAKHLNTTLEGFLNFQYKFGEIVDLSAMVGMGRYIDKGNGFNVSYENANDRLNSESVEKADGPFYPSSYKFENEKRSQFGRITGDFLNRYVISASVRRDGTDKFFPGKKYSWFPSVSLAWKIHEESFIRDITWINMLKLRASYGETGSDNLGSSLYKVITTTREDVKFDGNSVTYIPYISSGDNYTDVSWQKTVMKNIGLDFSLLHDRLSGSIDIFRNDITRMLGYDATELLGMYGSRPVNGGHFRREGIDINLNSTNINTKDFKWTSTLTLSHYNTEWVERMANYDYQVYQKRDHESTNAQYYYNQLGYVNADRSNLPESQRSLGTAACMPGATIIEDTNGDGIITVEDVQYYNATPKLYYGLGNSFQYKNFDLDIFFYGVLGQKKWNSTLGYAYYYPSSVDAANVTTYIYQTWNSQTNNGENARFPGVAQQRVSLPGNVGVKTTSFQDASFLRVRNITLGYTLPAKVMDVFNGYIKSIRVYVDFQNPFTFTKYEGNDPEIDTGTGNLNHGLFPQNRSYTCGLKLVF